MIHFMLKLENTSPEYSSLLQDSENQLLLKIKIFFTCIIK